MWSNRRLVEVFKIEHPIVLAPMAGLGTVDLAAAVSNAGGIGSIGCAVLTSELIAKTVAELRRLTKKPINLNFFCHDAAKADAARERAWHEKLSSYYRELGIAPATAAPRLDLAPFGDAASAVVEQVRPEVVSFHFGRRRARRARSPHHGVFAAMAAGDAVVRHGPVSGRLCGQRAMLAGRCAVGGGGRDVHASAPPPGP